MICPACSQENEPGTEDCFGCGKALFALTQGRVLADRYEILRPLGQGGMGKVYEALDRVLGESVAIKVLRPQFAREPEMAKRFLQEIRLARRITHTNVCRLHEYGESEGIRYLCMERVDGVNLKDVLRARRLDSEEAYDIALGAAEGLAAVHAQGVIHRDFKTANIMVDGQGRVKVMDFGIAKEVGADTTGLSLPGHVLGTPEYMSPEHAQGGTVDYRSDLYALGCVIFEVFAGRPLFQGASPIETLRRQLHDPAVFTGEQGLLVPEPLVPVLRRALAKKPTARYQNVTALVADLRAAREGSPLPSRQDGDDPLAGLLEPTEPLPIASGATSQRSSSGARAWLVASALTVLAVAAFAWWRGIAMPVAETPTAVTIASAPPPTVATLVAPAPPSTTLVAVSSPTPEPMPASRSRPPLGTEERSSPPPAPILVASQPPPLPSATAPPATAAPAPAPPPSTLAEESGVLNLIVVPPSEVSVDGKPLGQVSSRAIPLSAGTHDLLVENAEYRPYRRRVVVRAGTATDFVIDLSEKGVRRNP